jgi:hypothetical protein
MAGAPVSKFGSFQVGVDEELAAEPAGIALP